MELSSCCILCEEPAHTDQQFIDSVLHRNSRPCDIEVRHATGLNAAKLLMTPMRNAAVTGPALRKSHHQVGWYLAVEFLADIIGIEEHSILHVEGHDTSGYRLKHEAQTSIVALMRGGEPMALGISEAFPLTLFIYAKDPINLMPHHLQGQHTVVLVDSVVNTGKTVVQFVRHIRSIVPTLRIVVTTGVAQAQSVANLKKSLSGHADLSLVALRISDNKFTGTGPTDTGNRLFNTAHLL
jgi:uracil phosphoribosyltransferase